MVLKYFNLQPHENFVKMYINFLLFLKFNAYFAQPIQKPLQNWFSHVQVCLIEQRIYILNKPYRKKPTVQENTLLIKKNMPPINCLLDILVSSLCPLLPTPLLDL